MRKSVITVVVAILSVLIVQPMYAALSEDGVAWETDCSSLLGWYYNKHDAGMSTQVEIPKDQPSVLRIKQDGNDTWGKAVFALENINIAETPFLNVKVNQVDVGSAFKIAIAPQDWSELLVVSPRSSADGVHKCDLRRGVRSSRDKDLWLGETTFNLVFIIEGKDKSIYVDNIKLSNRK